MTERIPHDRNSEAWPSQEHSDLEHSLSHQDQRRLWERKWLSEQFYKSDCEFPYKGCFVK